MMKYKRKVIYIKKHKKIKDKIRKKKHTQKLVTSTEKKYFTGFSSICNDEQQLLLKPSATILFQKGFSDIRTVIDLRKIGEDYYAQKKHKKHIILRV